MFNVAITHDVDHLGVKDHYFDLSLLRATVLTFMGLFRKSASLSECMAFVRLVTGSLVKPGFDSWNCLDEWMALERNAGVSSTWFVACERGRGLAYRALKAAPAVDLLKRNGCAVGLHSQSRDCAQDLRAELEHFRRVFAIAGAERVPLRMHYLARCREDVAGLEQLFSFDSSIYDEQRFSCPDDYERPINIMDTYFFSPVHLNLPLAEAQKRTVRLIEEAGEQGKTVVIDLHQRHLSPCFPRYREYILWLYQQESIMTEVKS